MFFLYIAAVSLVLLIASAMSGFVPLRFLGDTIVAVLILCGLPCLPQLHNRLWKGQYDNIGRVTCKTLVLVAMFNSLITLPITFIFTEKARYHYLERLREDGVFIPPSG